jgi:hypothetical protein
MKIKDEISSYSSENSYYQKNPKNKCWQVCGKKGTLIHSVGGNVN